MQLIKYRPLHDLQRMERDLDKFWENDWGLLPTIGDMTAVDLYEEGGNLVAEIALPNFKKDEVKVTAEEDALEIRAEHSEKKEDPDKRHYYLQESSRHYMRRVALPEGADTNKATANFKDNVLKVTMPMTPTTKETVHEVPIS